MSVKFKSTININGEYTLPSVDGTDGQVIATDGAGNLSFQTISASGASGATTIYKDVFTGDSTTVEFTMAQITDNEVKTQVYFDGVYQSKDNYSINGAVITFSTAPPSGAAIEVITFATLTAGEDLNQKLSFYGKASGAITKGDAVMFAGAQGSHFLITKATQAALAANHEYFLGLAAQDLSNNEYGYVTEFGRLEDMDTSDYTSGDILWFDSEGSTAGAVTTTEPSAPNTKIQIAAVVRVHHNHGVIFVRPTIYHTLSEQQDVLVTSVADKDLLAWNASTGVWENTKTLGNITTGNITTSGTVDGVDVSSFKSDYDAHDHDSRYYTETEIDAFLTNKTNWDTAYGWGDHSIVGYLTSFTETDPIYTASSWYTTTNNSGNWDTSYGWGDHSLAGYLTSFTETDPVFSASASAGITSTQITNWDTAYGWGDHSTQSYATQTYVGDAIAALVDSAPATLDTLNELAAALGDDPNFATTVSTSIGLKWTQDNTKISNWDTSYGWGNHASAGYLTSFTEADPVYTSERDSLLFNKMVHAPLLFSNLSDYNRPSGYSTMIQPSSYQNPTGTYGYYHIIARRDGGGGYGALLQSFNGHEIYHGNTTESTSNINWYKIWTSGDFSSTDVSNWNTAYGWGNHASAGYITGYTETDTLASVTGRGSTTSATITAERYRTNNSLILNNYTTVNPASNVFLYSQPNDRDAWIFLDSADTGSNWGIYHRQIDSAVGDIPGNSIGFVGGGASVLQAYINLLNGDAYFRGSVSIAGNTAIHAGNIGSQSVSYASSAGSSHGIGYDGNAISGMGPISNWDSRPGVGQAGFGINWHTGVTISGYAGYGGVRLYASGYPTHASSVLRLEASEAVYTYGGLYSDGNAVIHAGNIGSQSVNYASSSGAVYGNQGNSFGLNDTKLYLRTNGDNNHYLWNAADDWEELNAYEGTGLRITSVAGSVGILYVYGSSNGGYTYSPYSFRAPIFYDSNNTAYYVDPHGTSNFNDASFGAGAASSNQGIQISYGNFSSGYGRIRFYQDGSNHQTIHSFSNSWQSGTLQSASSGAINIAGSNGVTFGLWNNPDMWIDGSGNSQSRGSSRAPIFYDSENTIYYVDPASTSNLNSITVNGGTNYFYGITYFETNNGGYLGATNSAKLQAYSSSNNSAFMSFHKGGHYAVNMGLDADNVFRIGGWSAGANRFQMDMSGNLTMAGDVTAYSDARVKENVVTIENALEKVLKSRGVYYNRTDSDDKKTKVGVIAQEILEVIPEVVNQDNDGMYNVSYGNITAVLIEAIKELSKKVEELEKKQGA